MLPNPPGSVSMSTEFVQPTVGGVGPSAAAMGAPMFQGKGMNPAFQKGAISNGKGGAGLSEMRVLVRNFPPTWCLAGKEILSEFIQAQLDSFGTLAGPVKVSPSLQEAEAVFTNPEDATQAICVLNGADLRGDEDKDDTSYKGLIIKPVSVPGQSQSAVRAAMTATQKPPQSQWVPPQPVQDWGAPKWPQKKQAAQKDKESKIAAPSPNKKSVSKYAEGTFADFEGVWGITYNGEDGPGMNYTIASNGDVRVGKKRTAQLVPAGTTEDIVNDANYSNKYFIGDVHRDGTWEYVWIEGGIMHVHHFSAHDTGTSPFGSPNFFGAGEGYLKDPDCPEPVQESWGQFASVAAASIEKTKATTETHHLELQENPPAVPVSVPELDGIWYITYQTAKGEQGGVKYTVSENGQVRIGKKRWLQLVHAGSVDDMRQDPNYQIDGCFLLDNVSGPDTWEYLWLENGMIQLHNFSTWESRQSPFGSPNFWGAGSGTTMHSGFKDQGRQSFASPVASFGGSAVGGGPSLREVLGGAPMSNPSFPPRYGVAPGVQMQQESWGGDAWDAPKKKKQKIQGSVGLAPGISNGGFNPSIQSAGPMSDMSGALATPQDFEGVWRIEYSKGGDMQYTIADGECRIGKKRRIPLVAAGSPQDLIQDFNYSGSYLLNNVHREGTWEYIWFENGMLFLHHFTSDDTGVSPFGSPMYWGDGQGHLVSGW